jgi:hypothetical protein
MIGETTRRHSLSHPYYQSLYSFEPEKYAVRAAALASLFENIELASADHGYPDYKTYLVGDSYRHPELRIAMSWQDREWSKEGEEFAKYANVTRLFGDIFEKHPHFRGNKNAQEHFLCRLIQQIRLAIRKDATIVGNDFFYSVYQIAAPHVKAFIDDSTGQLPEGLALNLGERTLDIVGLNFSPENFDEFAAVRSSVEISKYATAFREAVVEASSTPNLQSRLIDLMKEAMDSQDVARRAKGVFQTTGSILNVAGFIPIAGTIASVGGVVADAAERGLEKKISLKDWYLIGPKMKDVALKDFLSKQTSGKGQQGL